MLKARFRLLIASTLVLLGGALPAAAQASSTRTLTARVAVSSQGAVTLQANHGRSGAVDKMLAYATAFTHHHYAYVFGGGHAHAGQASTYDGGHRKGFDCSGAVAAVLAAGGLWKKGSPVGSDQEVISALRARHLLDSGPGSGPDEVSLYDVPGATIWMSIAGRFFDHGDNGAGWVAGTLYGGHIYHFKPSALKGSHGTPAQVTVQAGSSSSDELRADGLSPGADVKISYKQGKDASLALTAVSYLHATTVTGVVTNLAQSGAWIDIEPSGAKTLKLDTPPYPYKGAFGRVTRRGIALPPALTDGLYDAETVKALYTTQREGKHTELVLHTIKVLSQPAKDSIVGNVTAVNKNGVEFTLQVTTTGPGPTTTNYEFTIVSPSDLLGSGSAKIDAKQILHQKLKVDYRKAPAGIVPYTYSFSFA